MPSDLTPSAPGRRPAVLEADAESARRFAQAARSDATIRAYRSDWADFAAWCANRRLVAMPATPETVALYVASRVQAGPDGDDGQPTAPLKPATLSRRMAAISQAHKLAGLESPALRSKEPLHSVWAGVTRTLGTAQGKVAPALAADVVSMVSRCDEAIRLAAAFPDEARPGAALRARRDKVMLLLGFAAALRRSELAAVRIEHLSFTPDGLRLLIPRSKGDQQGAGQTVGVAYGGRTETCPVRAVRSYVAAASRALADQGRPGLSGPVFRSVDRWGRLGRKAITGRTVANVVKQYAAAAGLDPALYAGHSLRAGFATTAARAGKPDRAIQKQTRHRSAAMLAEYVREGRLFDDNASEGIGL